MAENILNALLGRRRTYTVWGRCNNCGLVASADVPWGTPRPEGPVECDQCGCLGMVPGDPLAPFGRLFASRIRKDGA